MRMYKSPHHNVISNTHSHTQRQTDRYRLVKLVTLTMTKLNGNLKQRLKICITHMQIGLINITTTTEICKCLANSSHHITWHHTTPHTIQQKQQQR